MGVVSTNGRDHALRLRLRDVPLGRARWPGDLAAPEQDQADYRGGERRGQRDGAEHVAGKAFGQRVSLVAAVGAGNVPDTGRERRPRCRAW